MSIRWNAEELTDQDSAGVADDSKSDFSGGLKQGYELGSLTDGLIAYYPFDGDVKDKALNNDGIDNTSAGYVSGKVGSEAKDFDGNDDFVDVPSFSTLDSFTLAVWGKVDNPSDGNIDPLIAINDNQRWYIANRESGIMRLRMDDGSGTGHSFDYSLDSKWHFYVITWNGEEFRAYADGSLLGSENVGSQRSTFSKGNRVGDWEDTNHYYLEGAVDDVRIYDRALSRPEVKELYQRSSTQEIADKDRLTSGLVGHWPLNEDDTTNAYDLSGRGNDASSVTGTSIASGLGGAKARRFDGSSYIDTGVRPLAGKSEATMSVFVNFDAFDSQNGVFMARGSSWGDSHGFQYDTNGTEVTTIISNGGTLAEVGDDVSNYSAGAWYHLAFTFDSGTVKLYRNGTEVGTDSTGPSSLSTNASNLQFGRADGAGRYHNGRIADGRVYNRVLSKSEIEELARMGGL